MRLQLSLSWSNLKGRVTPLHQCLQVSWDVSWVVHFQEVLFGLHANPSALVTNRNGKSDQLVVGRPFMATLVNVLLHAELLHSSKAIAYGSQAV